MWRKIEKDAWLVPGFSSSLAFEPSQLSHQASQKRDKLSLPCLNQIPVSQNYETENEIVRHLALE